MFLGVVLVSSFLLAQGANAQTPEQQIVADAAAGLGGRDRVLAVETLSIEGGGHDMSIGQSQRFDELGLQSDVNQIRGYKRVYDLANFRGRFEATREAQYSFYLGEGGARQVQALDGDVAFNVAPNGTATRVFGGQAAARRVEYLRHPLTIVRVALGPAARLANARTQGAERLVDVTSGSATVTLAVDGATKLPTRVVWLTDNPTLGDYAIETRFSDYRNVNGLQLPTLFTTRTDRFESAVVRIARQAVDENAGNLAAPAEVASAAPPSGAPAEFPVEAQEIAKGLWFVVGTTHHSLLAEFSDHMMLIEAPNEERTLRVLAKARELRPNKPVTTLLVTHHHGDHTGGVRTAVAEGVTEIVTHRTNVAYVNEILKRPHTINPDRLSKKPNAKPVKITVIDDEGVVKDGTMTISLYHILDNSHSDSMLMLYFPNGRILTQSDVYMPNDKRNIIEGEPLGHAPWLRNFLANINFRKLQVDYHAPIHGDYVPHSQFLESVITMTQFVAGRGSTN
jgi:glyoxylase-like metal-dependent hydrolase (beta-lactamase superfamily II)